MPSRLLGALKKCFQFPNPEDERHNFGFAHFVLILTLSPAIASLTLVRFSEFRNPTTWYESDIQRFAGTTAPRKPSCPQIGLVPVPCFDSLIYPTLRQRFETYSPPQLISKEHAIPSWLESRKDQKLVDVLSVAGFLLFFPCAWVCVRRRLWELLFCGLSLPLLQIAIGAYAHLGSAPAWFGFFFGYVAPKAVFLWLVLRGRPFSRPVFVGLGLMSAALIFSTAHTVLVLISIVGSIVLFLFLFGWLLLSWKAGRYLGEIIFRRWPMEGSNRFLTTLSLTVASGFALGRCVFSLSTWLSSKVTLGTVFAVFLVVINVINVGIPELIYALLPVLIFVMAAGIVQLFLFGIRANLYFLRRLGIRKVLTATLHAALLWIPMALLAAPYFQLTEVSIPGYVKGYLVAKGFLVKPANWDFRDNLLQSTASQIDLRIFQFHVQMGYAAAKVDEAAGAVGGGYLKTQVLNQLALVLPEELPMPPVAPTGTPVIGPALDYGLDKGEEAVKSGYSDLRQKIFANLDQAFTGLQNQFDAYLETQREQALKILKDAETQVTGMILDFNHQAQSLIRTYMSYLDAAHVLELFLFGFICVKSFLYVFSRVAFHKETGTLLTLGAVDREPDPVPEAQIKQTGGSYVIPDDSAVTFYISRRFQCRGKAPRFAIPQPFHAPIARLLHGATTMNKVVVKPGDGTVSCTAAKGAQFLEWSLREGEVVVFDFHNFVGMTEELQVSTLISLRLTTLLLGKFIFSTATGPGKLILKTDGRAEITGRDEIADSLPPERLVAMHRETRLSLDSELGIVDVYLSTAYVRPQSGGQVIVDVDSQRGSASGLGRFFLHFIWPG